MEDCLQKMKARCLAPGFCLAHADRNEGSFIYLNLSSQAAPAVMASLGSVSFPDKLLSEEPGTATFKPTYPSEGPCPSLGAAGLGGAGAAQGFCRRSSGPWLKLSGGQGILLFLYLQILEIGSQITHLSFLSPGK